MEEKRTYDVDCCFVKVGEKMILPVCYIQVDNGKTHQLNIVSDKKIEVGAEIATDQQNVKHNGSYFVATEIIETRKPKGEWDAYPKAMFYLVKCKRVFEDATLN